MSKKKIAGYIKLTIIAGKADPPPSVGQALGPRGVKTIEFYKSFIAATQNIEPGTPVPVVVTVFENKSFTFVTKTPPTSYYLMQYAKIEKGASNTKKEEAVGKLTLGQCRQIAEKKFPDLNAKSIEGALKMVIGSAESMGILVVED